MIFKDIKFSLGALRLRYFGGGRGISKNAIFCMGFLKMRFLYGVVENAIFVWGCRKCHFCMGVSKMSIFVWGLKKLAKFHSLPILKWNSPKSY